MTSKESKKRKSEDVEEKEERVGPMPGPPRSLQAKDGEADEGFSGEFIVKTNNSVFSSNYNRYVLCLYVFCCFQLKILLLTHFCNLIKTKRST